VELGEKSDRLLGWALRLAIFNDAKDRRDWRSRVYYNLVYQELEFG